MSERTPSERLSESVARRLGVDNGRADNGARELVAVPFSGIEPEHVEWLMPDRVPLGMLTLLAGDPGLGKSQWACDLAARVSRDGGAVLYASAEDSASATLRPRLEAAGAVLDRVRLLRLATPGNGDGITIPHDLDRIGALMDEAAYRLFVVDPLGAHLPSQVNSYQDASVRRALAPLHDLGEKHRCTPLVIAHLNKASDHKALYRVGGSIALVGAARSVLFFARDPQDPDPERGPRRILAHPNCNVGREQPALGYEVEETATPGGFATSVVRFTGERDVSAEELLAAPKPGERDALADAEGFLTAELADGARAASEVEREAREAGHSSATLKRARQRLGVESRRVGGAGSQGRWEWHLPIAAEDAALSGSTPPPPAQSGRGEPLSESPAATGDSAPSGTLSGSYPGNEPLSALAAESDPAYEPATDAEEDLAERLFGREAR